MTSIVKHICRLFLILSTLAGPGGGRAQEGVPARDTAAAASLAGTLLEQARAKLHQAQWEDAIAGLDSAIWIMEGEGMAGNLLYSHILHQKGRSLTGLGKYSEALIFLEQALHLRRDLLPSGSLLLAESYYGVGYAYQNLGEFSLALSFHGKAYEIRKKEGPADSWQMARTLGHLGFCHIMAGDFLQAEYYLNRAVEVQAARGEEAASFTAWLNGKLGYTYYCLREYDKAVLHHEIALGILGREKKSRTDSLEQAWNMLILGNAQAELSHYEKGLEYLQRAMRYYRQTLGPEHLQLAQVTNDIGYFYYNRKAYEKAIELHEAALEIRLKADGSEESIGQSYLNLGDCHFAIAGYRQALEFYEKAYDYRLLSLGQYHPFTIYCLMRQASCQQQLRQFNQANYLLSKVFQYLQIDPEAKEETHIQHPVLVLEALGRRAVLYKEWYEENQRLASLNTAMRYFRYLDDYTDYILAFFEKQQIASVKFPYFEAAMQLCARAPGRQAISPEEAFYFSEKAKALILHQSMQEADALAYAGIPDSLLSCESALKEKLSFFEKLRRDKLQEEAGEEDSTFTAINERIASLREGYKLLQKELEANYPDYFRLKYDLSPASLSYVQDSLLQPGQTLLEYFVGDSSIFIMLVQKGHYELQEIPRDFPLEEWISQMREGIYGYHNAPPDKRSDSLRLQLREAYVEAAYRLYEKLVAPVKNKLTKELALIPDGILGYLPFEALLTSRPAKGYRFQSHPYLLHDHQVSYCYSATLLRNMREKQHGKSPEKDFLAFAPYYDGDTTFLAGQAGMPSLQKNEMDTLLYSAIEVLRLQKLLGGDIYLGRKATKSRFTRLAGNYRLLHLSTHGKASSTAGDYSFLAFYPPPDSLENERLYAKDLYNLRLNADMVALSACESGIGQLQRGEGIISLARAFAYAGAKSILTTLWKVDDRFSAELTERFYQGLKKGLPKDAALRQAKLQLIGKSRNAREAHPYFWAGFIGIGDMSPVY